MSIWKPLETFLGGSDSNSALSRAALEAFLPTLKESHAAIINYRRDLACNYGCRYMPEDEAARLLSNFQYRSLPRTHKRDSLRMLKILPRGAHDRVNCELRTFSLEDCPEYDALSYCWGTAPRSLAIRCNGYDLPVTPTVAAALSRLCLRGCKYLWIDAICINQDDLKEREQQVQMMQSIYSGADNVFIWIGGEQSSEAYGIASKVVFPTLRLYANDRSAAIEARRAKPVSVGKLADRDVREETNWLNMDNAAQSRHNKFTTSLEQILALPWFTRMWCVQEAVMAKHAVVINGPHEISWATFCKGLRTAVQCDVSCKPTWGAFQQDNIFARKLQSLARFEEPLDEDTAASFLMHLLFKHRQRMSTDPRDKVYGLIGIVNYFFAATNLPVSYSEPTETVYTSITKYILEHMRTSHILSACHGPSRAGVTCSWVPDWSLTSPLPKLLQAHGPHAVGRFRSTSSAKLRNCAFHDASILTLCGNIVDSIRALSEMLPVGQLQGRDWDLEAYVRFTGSGLKNPIKLFVHLGMKQMVADTTESLGIGSDALWQLASDSARDMQMLHSIGITPTSFVGERQSDEPEPISVIDDLRTHRPTWMEESAGKRLRFLISQVKVFLAWDLCANHRGRRSRYPAGDSYTKAYWQTLCAGNTIHNTSTTAGLFRQWQDSLESLRDFSEINLDDITDNQAGLIYMILFQFKKKLRALLEDNEFAQLLDYAYLRRFGRTVKGYYCLLPSAAREDDFIGLFEGADVPLVVREYGEQWQVVGECYIHGIMHGELWDAAKCKSFQFR